MTVTTTNNSYTVTVRLNLEFSLDINAASLEEAVSKAKAFETIDLIKKIPEVVKNSNFNDYDHKIVGIWDNE